MHLSDGARLYSAKDLLNFLGCAHSSALDLQLIERAITPPDGDTDEYLDLLKKKGIEHEARYLGELKVTGKSVTEIARDPSLATMAEQTRQAMRSGVDVIYQGALVMDERQRVQEGARTAGPRTVNLPWHGYSDFLVRVERPSKLGPLFPGRADSASCGGACRDVANAEVRA